jgi:hypothetical protein
VPFYVRYESAVVNNRGGYTGIFGLANGLARSGRLSPGDWTWWRVSNDWFNAAYTDPAAVDSTLFNRAINPIAICWFNSTATYVLDPVPGYLALLDRYDIPWRIAGSEDPGRLLYEDDVQVVVASRTAPALEAPQSRI